MSRGVNNRRWHATMALAMALASVGIPARADFYVAPDGDDTNPGTASRPFASPERARLAVRELKAKNGLPEERLTIWFRGGDYLRTNAFELGPEDSGEPGRPMIWRAVDDTDARWLGGRRITGLTVVKDPAVLARLAPDARGQVYAAELRAVGVADPGAMRSRGFGRATTPAHAELFFGGRPMTLARWPNEGAWETIAGFPNTAGKGDDHGGRIGDLPGGFLYRGDRPRGWRDVRDLWVHGYWAWDWANSYERVEALDLERRWVRTAPPHGLYGFRAGQRFYFLNVLEELDQRGEWFLDRRAGTLYFWPPAPVESGETWLSLLDQPLVRCAGASHVVIRGLTLEATRGSGIEIRGGAQVLVTGCRLRNLGDAGVVITGGTNHGVVSCDVTDTGDGGVSLEGGDRRTLTPGGHYVENCHFQRQGRWSKCYVPAVLMTGVGLRASHNHIHDHPHCAILFSGNDHLIEFNDIHHIALETGDVGAIYAGRDYTYRGNRIRHNYIHETGGVGMGSMGVYMDDCVSGTEVFGNVFYRVHWAMFIGGGRDHRVENNVFVECDPAVRADGRGLDPSPVWRGMVDDYMRRQLAAVPAALYRERYPALRALDAYYGPPGGPAIQGAAFRGVPPEGNVIARNVCFGKWLDIGWRAKAEQIEFRDNVVTNDLRQVQGRDGFRPPAGSPAWQLGFQAIPFDEIGLQRDPDRERWGRLETGRRKPAGER